MRDVQHLRRALDALGGVLADRGLAFHVAIAGGSALLLMEGGSRPTQDVDVVAWGSGRDPLRVDHLLPAELVEAAQDVATVLELDPDWLNAGAVALVGHVLPAGYESRLRSEDFGNLTVSVLAREDLLRLKLYAASDEGPGSVHLLDLRSLAPTPDELREAAEWVREHQPNLLLADVLAYLEDDS
jgi:hypothetical protein